MCFNQLAIATFLETAYPNSYFFISSFYFFLASKYSKRLKTYEYILVFAKIAIQTANSNYLLHATSIFVVAQNIAISS